MTPTERQRAREAARQGAESLRTSAYMAGRRGWPQAVRESEAYAQDLDTLIPRLLDALEEAEASRRPDDLPRMFDEYTKCVAGVFRRAVDVATAMLHKEGGDKLALLKEALAVEVRGVNEREARLRAILTPTPLQSMDDAELAEDFFDYFASQGER